MGEVRSSSHSTPDKSLSVYVQADHVSVNGKLAPVESFSKLINQATAHWDEDDFELFGLSLRVEDDVPSRTIAALNAEYAKSELAKHSSTESSFIPESPPAPFGIKEIINESSAIFFDEDKISSDEAFAIIQKERDKIEVSIRESQSEGMIVYITRKE